MLFVIPGDPISKKRHKCACRGGKPIAYDPQLKEEMQQVKNLVTTKWIKAFESESPEIKLEASRIAQADSYYVACTFVFQPSRSLSQSKKNHLLWGFENHNIKPDVDNLAKFYYDALTGVVWDDDCRIVVGSCVKKWGEDPRTEIEIRPLRKFMLSNFNKNILKIFTPTELGQFIKDSQQLGEFNGIEQNVQFYEELIVKILSYASKYADNLKKIEKIADKEFGTSKKKYMDM